MLRAAAMRCSPRVVLLAAAACLLATASPLSAHATAAEGLKRFGGAAGFAGVAGSEGSYSGFGGALVADYGLTDAWALAANVTATSNRVTPSGGRSLVLSQAVGVDYALDVINIIPYFGLYGALYELRGGGLSKTTFKAGAQIALGLDYLVSRKLFIGLDIRLHALPADILSNPDNPTPFYMTTFVRAMYAWGWY